MMKVIVTDADYKNTLAAIRSLGKRGIYVCGGGKKITDHSLYSKYCKRRIIYPNPSENAKSFINFMLKFVKKENYDVLLPIGVNTTIPLSFYKEKFEKYIKLPIASYDTLIKAHDKSKILKIAKKIGIEIPLTYYPKSLKDVKNISQKIKYPCVVKLKRGSAAKGLRYVNSPEELIKCYEIPPIRSDMVFDYSFPMIQEYIPGEVHDICVLFNNGKPRAVLTQRRIWMHPINGGGGIYNETTNEPKLKEITIKLLKKIKWHGPAQVEFKIDSRDKKPKLMEVNSKFWGTLDLSIQAGIDFPYLACKMAVDGDIKPVFKYKVGLKYKWIFPYGLLYFIQSKNKFKNLKELFRFDANTKYDIHISDLLPHVARFFSILYKFCRLH